jgi:hypothetical protein
MADYASTEGRAVYNKAVSQGRAGERYLGLTYWTPNINIFRDPRWVVDRKHMEKIHSSQQVWVLRLFVACREMIQNI